MHFRCVWIHGRYGGGKTSLAVILAARLTAEGYTKQVVSNIPLTFSVEPKSPLEHAAIILDEAWLYIENRRDVMDYAAFIRKFEHWLILPGIFPVHNRLAFLRVQRVWNGYTVGIPMWSYKWRLRSADVKEDGGFSILNPVAVFGHYPSRYVPGTDGGISEVVLETAKSEGFKGTRSQQKAVSMATLDNLNLDETVAAMDDVSFEIQESVEAFDQARKKAARLRIR